MSLLSDFLVRQNATALVDRQWKVSFSFKFCDQWETCQEAAAYFCAWQMDIISLHVFYSQPMRIHLFTETVTYNLNHVDMVSEPRLKKYIIIIT